MIDAAVGGETTLDDVGLQPFRHDISVCDGRTDFPQINISRVAKKNIFATRKIVNREFGE